ncbi:protein-glutamine gamma-glutamyltransferase 6 [Xenopus tropicalis]|uniref:protein-glutamine gamma-glutamyltransferase n=1 Tax=Xenopus tropicalis TaxID=8364 RepID=A0A8J0QHE0_XENTR|nr:protein-glutamine gamma-glutamyltransferase 6 [Xenopus tropicalis]
MEESSNMAEHRTNYYSSSDLILRRAQAFRIMLYFNRPLREKDKVEFTAATGPDPQEADDTMCIFPLFGSQSKASWTAEVDSIDSNCVTAIITSSADAVIGRYKLQLYTTSSKKKSYFKLREFVLLFNPWAEDDVVYMEDENERCEYVLNDHGIIYFGHEEMIDEQGWDFGQFEENILDISLQILDRSLNYQDDPVLDCSQRYDPGYVGRVLTAMINSFDDDGVLEGRWTGKFTGGVDPQHWIGSVEILMRWYRGGYKPVKYGQCWVFAAVMCTVLRCLGIPTRVITNFASAHDKDGNLGIDSIYSSSGRNMSKDTMWNFHVWNESWFRRNDLGSAYRGWQVLDATPQELSEGTYCCGPASVHAVKEGDVDKDYNVPFVFAEVNADRNTWVYYAKDVKEKVYTDSKSVGKHMSTKSVGGNERVEITNNYKYPEGTEKERQVYLKARKKLLDMGVLKDENLGRRFIGKKRYKKRGRASESADDSEEPTELGIIGKFQLVAPPKFGDDVNLILSLRNSGQKSEALKVKLSSSAIKYTGRPMSEIFSDQTSVTLGSMKEKQIPINIAASQYEEELTKDHLIEVVALCELKSKKKMLVRRVVSIEKPPLLIQVLSYPVVDELCELQVSFKNPLSVPLTDGILLLGGSGLIRKQIKRRVPKLGPKAEGSIVLEITPYRFGTQQLVVDFISKHFSAIKGFKRIEVAEDHLEDISEEIIVIEDD